MFEVLKQPKTLGKDIFLKDLNDLSAKLPYFLEIFKVWCYSACHIWGVKYVYGYWQPVFGLGLYKEKVPFFWVQTKTWC